MNLEKSEVLKHCKTLLRLINCEAVIDTKNEALYDILFNSHTKKKMLLSWLIQQIYSTEYCASLSFEDIISIFIPKKHLQNFLSGKMPMSEQYKWWKLIMNVLHQRQRRKAFSDVNMDKETECAVLLEKYENMWSEKLAATLNYVGLVPAKEAKSKTEELQSLLKLVKGNKIELISVPANQECPVDFDPHTVQIEFFLNLNKEHDRVIREDFMSSKTSVSIQQLEILPTYLHLNSRMLNDAKNKLQTLTESVGMFNKLIHGAENLQF